MNRNQINIEYAVILIVKIIGLFLYFVKLINFFSLCLIWIISSSHFLYINNNKKIKEWSNRLEVAFFLKIYMF